MEKVYLARLWKLSGSSASRLINPSSLPEHFHPQHKPIIHYISLGFIRPGKKNVLSNNVWEIGKLVENKSFKVCMSFISQRVRSRTIKRCLKRNIIMRYIKWCWMFCWILFTIVSLIKLIFDPYILVWYVGIKRIYCFRVITCYVYFVIIKCIYINKIS